VVNDSLGHVAGNELLREIARRLQHNMPPDVLVARLGGDEFGVLQNNLKSHDQGLSLATHMLALLAEPLTIQGHEIVPSASVGITFSDLGARSVDELLRDADLAMYEAKSSGRHRVAVFDRSMHERIADKLALEAELRRAIGDGELTLNYQPIYALSPQKLTGFEALARWVHPTRGPISPALFIALAEESGQIQALTGWVIERALSQLAAWRRQSPDHADVVININMSGHDLMAPGFVDNVLAALTRHGVRPHQLMLEITESVLMGQLEGTRANLNRLRECGVQVAIDDFGTGYSSLAYLSTLPIDCLKIDRSFVMAMDDGHQSEEIVRAILMLGCTLSKRVVAEGVETHEQLEKLRRLGVHAAQGYLLGKPMRADQVLPMLQRVSGDTVDVSKPSNTSAVADALMAA
jgi:diguanylate cyclase (GGDEF)-like protein